MHKLFRVCHKFLCYSIVGEVHGFISHIYVLYMLGILFQTVTLPLTFRFTLKVTMLDPISRNDVSHAFHSVADEVCTDNRFMQIMHLLNSVWDFL